MWSGAEMDAEMAGTLAEVETAWAAAGRPDNKTLEHRLIQHAFAFSADANGWRGKVEDGKSDRSTITDAAMMRDADATEWGIEVQIAEQTTAATLARTLNIYRNWQKGDGRQFAGVAPFTIAEAAAVLGCPEREVGRRLSRVCDLAGWDFSDGPPPKAPPEECLQAPVKRSREKMLSRFRVLWVVPDRDTDARPVGLMDNAVVCCPTVALTDLDPTLPRWRDIRDASKEWAERTGGHEQDFPDRRDYRMRAAKLAQTLAVAAMRGEILPEDEALEADYDVCPLLAVSPGVAVSTVPALGDHLVPGGAWLLPRDGSEGRLVTLADIDASSEEGGDPFVRAAARHVVAAVNRAIVALREDGMPEQAVARCGDGRVRCLVEVPAVAESAALKAPMRNDVSHAAPTVGLASACDPVSETVLSAWRRGRRDFTDAPKEFASTGVARLPALSRGWCVSGMPLSPRKMSDIAATAGIEALRATVEATRERQASTYSEGGRLAVRGRRPGRRSSTTDNTTLGVLTRERGAEAVLGGYRQPGLESPMTGDHIRAVLSVTPDREEKSNRRQTVTNTLRHASRGSIAPQNAGVKPSLKIPCKFASLLT